MAIGISYNEDWSQSSRLESDMKKLLVMLDKQENLNQEGQKVFEEIYDRYEYLFTRGW